MDKIQLLTLNPNRTLPVTNCTQTSFEFPSCKRRRVQASFDGGAISSDGGVGLLRLTDQRLGLSEAVAGALGDERRRASCTHGLVSLVRQRLYGLALGYEDLNDHQSLRDDVAIQTAVGTDAALASQSTLCRWENRADREAAWALHRVLVEQFIASFAHRPKKLVLDFDATDDRLHGKQEGRFFHGYYDHYCYLPLYVTCRDQVLVSYLRPSNIDGAQHAWAILALLVRRLRQAWPKVRIVMRADSGFCRWRMLRWCERHGVEYIVGIAKNSRLEQLCAPLQRAAAERFETTGAKVRDFDEFLYGARTWDRRRRIIARIEHTDKGANPRFVVTNIDGKPKSLYDKLYCARGDMENRIKEQQLDLFADRTSAATMWANQLRLYFSSLAYCMLQALRRLGLADTSMAKAQCATIRLRLLKIGARVKVTVRNIWVSLSQSYPDAELFAAAHHRLLAPPAR